VRKPLYLEVEEEEEGGDLRQARLVGGSFSPKSRGASIVSTGYLVTAITIIPKQS